MKKVNLPLLLKMLRQGWLDTMPWCMFCNRVGLSCLDNNLEGTARKIPQRCPQNNQLGNQHTRCCLCIVRLLCTWTVFQCNPLCWCGLGEEDLRWKILLGSFCKNVGLFGRCLWYKYMYDTCIRNVEGEAEKEERERRKLWMNKGKRGRTFFC